MQFGYHITGGKQIVLATPLQPTLIVRSRDTFLRMFMETEEPKAYFGDCLPLLPFVKDYVLFDGSSIPFNPLDGDPQHVLDACKAVWDYGASVQVDKDFLMAIAALKETKGTFFQLPYLFISDTFRKKTLKKLKDPVLYHYWTWFDSLPLKDQTPLAAPIVNRLMPLNVDKDMRRILSQRKSFTPSKTLLVDVRNPLLAALLMASWQGVSFIENPSLHVGDSLPIMHVDYLDQLSEKLQTKMLNTATIMTTRLGTYDADILEPHFNLKTDDFSLAELPLGRAHVRLEKTHTIYTHAGVFPVFNEPPLDLAKNPKDIDAKIAKFMGGM
jgi:hypothetical protein